jgi:phosphoribosyl-dephospho-CoA transferase
MTVMYTTVTNILHKVSQKELWQVKQLRNNTQSGQIQQYEMQFMSDTMNVVNQFRMISHKKKTKLHGLSPQANYTDRAAAAGRRS